MTTSIAIATTRINPAANVAYVSENEIIDILLAIKGAKILSFVAQTDPKPLKKSRETKQPTPWASLIKIARLNGMVNFHYDAGVLRRLEKEGKDPSSFRQGESWHEPLTIDGKLTPFCTHKKTGKLYIRFQHLSTVESKYIGDGNVMDFEQVKDYLPQASNYGNQGLSQPLIFLVYGMDTIQSVNLDGMTYLIRR